MERRRPVPDSCHASAGGFAKRRRRPGRLAAFRWLHAADRSYAWQQGFYPTVSVRMPLDAAVPTTQGVPRVVRNCMQGLFFVQIDSTTTAFPTPAHDFFAHGFSYVDEDVRRRNHSPQPVPER